jgi:dihydroorotate dehydrogenase
VCDARANLATPHNQTPLVLKIAPDVSLEELQDIAQVALDFAIDGIIVANTTISRPSNLQSGEC